MNEFIVTEHEVFPVYVLEERSDDNGQYPSGVSRPRAKLTDDELVRIQHATVEWNDVQTLIFERITYG